LLISVAQVFINNQSFKSKISEILAHFFCSHTADVGVPPTYSRRASRDEPLSTILLLTFIAQFAIDNQSVKIEMSNFVAHFFAIFQENLARKKLIFLPFSSHNSPLLKSYGDKTAFVKTMAVEDRLTDVQEFP